MTPGKFSVKLVKFMIGIVAALALFMIIMDRIKEYRKAYDAELTSTESSQGTDVKVVIPENASVKEIAHILYRKGLIKYEGAFVDRLQSSEYRGELKHGTYTLNTGMNTLQMMEIMSKEDETGGVLQKLVVPEGFSIDQIAERCEEQDICTADEFINACKSVTRTKFPFLADVPTGVDVRYRLEGYLFPATYDITKDTTAESLVYWMLDTFLVYYDDERQARAEELGLNSYQVVNMAAMIERECRVPDERPVIAGVINNRLKDNMLLQIDSTVLYPITKGLYNKEKVTYEDLEVNSKYNTYKYEGLPAGPICNPGIACINAVLYPSEHEFYYYHVVNEETGEHAFFRTYEEHESGEGGVTVEDMQREAEEKTKESGQDGDDEGSDDSE
jgi:UPF0755 protein